MCTSVPKYETLKKQSMEISYKNGKPTKKLVKHVERDNFPTILYRIFFVEGT